MCKVLKNGVEVKLQRNALSVLEHLTKNEDDDLDYNSSSSSDIHGKNNDFCKLPTFYDKNDFDVIPTLFPNDMVRGTWG